MSAVRNRITYLLILLASTTILHPVPSVLLLILQPLLRSVWWVFHTTGRLQQAVHSGMLAQGENSSNFTGPPGVYTAVLKYAGCRKNSDLSLQCEAFLLQRYHLLDTAFYCFCSVTHSPEVWRVINRLAIDTRFPYRQGSISRGSGYPGFRYDRY
jgi:hypothetical protein